MPGTLITLQAALTGFSWAVVAFGAVVAVLSARIKDTAWERLGLASVSMACVSASWQAFTHGAVSGSEATVAVSMAFYVLSLFWKHWCFLPPGETPAPKA